VFTEGRADAALAASIFHYAEHAVEDLKAHLHSHRIPVRLDVRHQTSDVRRQKSE
jgi:cyclase